MGGVLLTSWCFRMSYLIVNSEIFSAPRTIYDQTVRYGERYPDLIRSSRFDYQIEKVADQTKLKITLPKGTTSTTISLLRSIDWLLDSGYFSTNVFNVEGETVYIDQADASPSEVHKVELMLVIDGPLLERLSSRRFKPLNASMVSIKSLLETLGFENVYYSVGEDHYAYGDVSVTRGLDNQVVDEITLKLTITNTSHQKDTP